MEKHVPYGLYEKYFKRPIDFCCGLAAVIVFSLLYLILIVLGAIFMRGNPFFTQDRPGKDEKVFKLIKFRTMDNRRDKNGKLLGGGESGSETVVGTKSLLRMIKRAVYEAVGPLVIASRELAKASAELGYVTYNGFAKLNEHRGGNDETGQGDNNSGGDTFIFNSPKAIDEIEAAKQMKKAKRELAEGF